MEPTIGYDGDAEAIGEPAAGLGTKLFPIGYESSQYSIITTDERGRIFALHHTGVYYLGEDIPDAFSRFMKGASAPDAEDFFV